MTAADPATSTVLSPWPDPRTAVVTGAGGPAGTGSGKYTHYSSRMKADTRTNRRTNLPARCQARCDSTSVCLPGSSCWGTRIARRFSAALRYSTCPAHWMNSREGIASVCRCARKRL